MTQPRSDVTVPTVVGLLPFLLPLYAALVVALKLAGAVSESQAAMALVAPAAPALILWRPGWFLCLLLAVPPGLVALSPLGRPDLLMVVLAGLLVFRLLMGGRIRVPAVIAPFLLLLGVAALMSGSAGGVATSIAARVLEMFLYYGLLSIAAHSLISDEELAPRTIVTALAFGALGTVIVLGFQTGASPAGFILNGGDAPPRPGLLGYRTHFGYLMAIGLAATLPRALERERGALRWRLAVGLFAVMALLSFTRGAWAAAILMAVPMLWSTRRRGALVVALCAVAVLVTIPRVSERVTGGASGDLATAVTSSEFTSGRTRLWSAMAREANEGLPWGNGFGHVWSLSAERLFGSSASFGDGTVVYPHNDFLFWAVDLGFPGILLFGLLWVGAARVLIRARRSLPRTEWHALLGIVITMLIASLVDNGIFIRSLGEPFFVALGVLAAVAGGREVVRRWT